MTDAEIIKALECCIKFNCINCPLRKMACSDTVAMDHALDLINRQKAEIERLKKLLDEEEKQYRLCAKRFYEVGVKDLAERLKNYYATKKNYDRPNAHTLISFLFALIDDLIEEMAGDTE